MINNNDLKSVLRHHIITDDYDGKVIQPSSKYASRNTDLQLWQEFKSGNETAFASIYNNNIANLYHYGLSLVHDENLVKDCIQDFFVELWNSKNRLSDIKSIQPYLYKSIRRKIIGKASSTRKRQFALERIESCENMVSSAEISLFEKQRFDEERRRLKKALNALNPKQREIIYLKFYGLLSYKEISEVMSLDKKGVYNLMAYTIKLLRQHMAIVFIFSFLHY